MEKNLPAFSFSFNESTAQLHEFFMQTPMAIAILEGPEHVFTLANPQYEKLVGRKVIGKKVLESFTTEELGPYLSLVGNVFKTGVPWSGSDQPFHIAHESGRIHECWLDIAYYPVRDIQGLILGVLAVISNVTEQYKAKKILLENSDAMPHMFWSAKPDGLVDWYDDKFYTYTGMKQGGTWNDSESPLHTDDLEPITRLWTQSIETGTRFEVNLRLRRKADENYHWFLSRATPVRDEQGQIIRWIGTLTDVHSDRLVLSQLQIEREMRERFVATLSHDLRSPMASARMSAQLLSRNSDKPDFLEKYSQKIIKNIDRADEMIRDLLDANRISAGEGLPITVERCNLGLIALEVIDELRVTYGDRFKLQVPVEVKGQWSKSGLRRILENLICNGLKYGDENFPVTISLSRIEKNVLIEVHNLGTPISPAYQQTIFEQYRRLPNADGSAHKGWGLGLTLVKGIAAAHGGQVSVASSLEAGTTFTVTLPD